MHCGTCVTQTGKSKHNTVSQAGAKSNGVLERRARFHGCAVRHARDGMERLRNRCLDGKLSNAACRLLLGTGGAMPHHCQRICESVCQRLLRGLFVRLLGLLPCRLVGVRAAPHERHHGREDQHAASHRSSRTDLDEARRCGCWLANFWKRYDTCFFLAWLVRRRLGASWLCGGPFCFFVCIQTT